MYEVYERLCRQNGVSTSDVCKATGIGYSTISNWKKRRNLLSAKYAKLIADYFGVSLDYLMTGETELSQEELDRNEMEMEQLHRAAFRPEMELLIDTVKDAPDDVLIRLRYYAEGLIAGRKDN